LKELIKAHDINVRQIFENFDTDKSKELNFPEFCRFVHAIAPGLKEHELMQVFGKFD
jgi:Ca2+-binding EF-hand superfamily protein